MDLSPMQSPLAQSLRYKFTVPGRHPAEVQVTVGRNEHPENAGMRLLFPDQALGSFVDFPVCSATVTASDDHGYAATYGWIQMVREIPLHKGSPGSGQWEMDPIPITADLNTPFVWFGPEPRLFDAPFRANRTDMDWTCWSFLTYIEDALVSKKIRPVLAFEWGFRMEGGEVTIKTLRGLEIARAWEQQRGLLEGKFGGWGFQMCHEGVEVREVIEST